jgi:hypothetical protein
MLIGWYGSQAVLVMVKEHRTSKCSLTDADREGTALSGSPLSSGLKLLTVEGASSSGRISLH